MPNTYRDGWRAFLAAMPEFLRGGRRVLLTSAMLLGAVIGVGLGIVVASGDGVQWPVPVLVVTLAVSFAAASCGIVFRLRDRSDFGMPGRISDADAALGRAAVKNGTLAELPAHTRKLVIESARFIVRSMPSAMFAPVALVPVMLVGAIVAVLYSGDLVLSLLLVALVALNVGSLVVQLRQLGLAASAVRSQAR